MNTKRKAKRSTRKSEWVYVAVIAVFAVLITVIFIVWGSGKKEKPDTAVIETSDTDSIVVIKEVDKLVEVEKTITGTILQDGLNNMGFLITQEYWFTEAVEYSSVKSLFGIDLPFTESGYLFTYDGCIYAGIDFESIKVKKDDGAKHIRVTVPAPEIQSIDIDFDSFRLYGEKVGFANRPSIADYNSSLSNMKNTARSKAISRGILDKAYDNACSLIKNFIGGMTDIRGYEFEFVPAG